jgi:hypothetical protein
MSNLIHKGAWHPVLIHTAGPGAIHGHDLYLFNLKQIGRL